MLQTKDMPYEVERICDFIRKQVATAKANGVVIGVSGGIDSALVAKLCVLALGRNKIYGLSMPYGNQSGKDGEDLIKKLDLTGWEINIKNSVDIILENLTFTPEDMPQNKSKLIKGNICARVRMINLYTQANQYNLLVAGTGNRSEHMVGYFTKYGDGGTDFEPIEHLYKTEVWAMAKYLKLPKKIINKVPSAELWEGQTDEGELGITYKELDKILECMDGYDGVISATTAKALGVTYELAMKVQSFKVKSKHKRDVPPSLRREYGE
jgi:NAD+ synthase